MARAKYITSITMLKYGQPCTCIMTEFLIDCVTRDQFGDIIRVGMSGQRNDAQMLADYIWKGGKDEYYTLTRDRRYKKRVVARIRDGTRKLYLTTSRDGIELNNLDSLPDCSDVVKR